MEPLPTVVRRPPRARLPYRPALPGRRHHWCRSRAVHRDLSGDAGPGRGGGGGRALALQDDGGCRGRTGARLHRVVDGPPGPGRGQPVDGRRRRTGLRRVARPRRQRRPADRRRRDEGPPHLGTPRQRLAPSGRGTRRPRIPPGRRRPAGAAVRRNPTGAYHLPAAADRVPAGDRQTHAGAWPGPSPDRHRDSRGRPRKARRTTPGPSRRPRPPRSPTATIRTPGPTTSATRHSRSRSGLPPRSRRNGEQPHTTSPAESSTAPGRPRSAGLRASWPRRNPHGPRPSIPPAAEKAKPHPPQRPRARAAPRPGRAGPGRAGRKQARGWVTRRGGTGPSPSWRPARRRNDPCCTRRQRRRRRRAGP